MMSNRFFFFSNTLLSVINENKNQFNLLLYTTTEIQIDKFISVVHSYKIFKIIGLQFKKIFH